MAGERLRVGVPARLLALPPHSGHGRVWNRVLGILSTKARIVELDPTSGQPTRRLTRSPSVVLADGHDPIAPVSAPLVVQVHEAGWSTPELQAVLDSDFLAHIAAHTEANVRAAAQVITPSESARRDIVDGYGVDPDRVHSVPHGVDPAFSPAAPGGRDLVAAERNGEPAPYVLYAAMLHPRKNLEALRTAMSTLIAEGLPHVLAIVGGPASDRRDSSGLERAATAELPGAPGRVVRFHRPSDAELAGLMAEADAFCLPSLYEGFGLTVLEAMACGTPVIVSDRGALPEVVGDTGLIVPPEASAVADALRRLLSNRDLAESLAAAGAARAREFTWSRTAAGWLDVLRLAADGVRN